MQNSLIRGLVAATAVAAALVTASCSGPAQDTSATTSSVVAAPSAKALVDKGATLVDVRTPAEFAAGHLAGATNIDVTAADFAARVKALDTGGTYVVYCHSGNRAAAAVDQMDALGFTHAVNGGGFADLASAGVPAQ
jgi:rhodanese-related sulfurtransferase